jgi:hypothetical protein
MCETIHLFDEYPGAASEQKRKAIDPLIFDILKKKYGRTLKTHFDSCQIPKTAEKTILLLCRNFHEHFEFILHNCAYFAKGWAITVLCSEVNANFCRILAGSQADSITFLKIFKDTASEQETQKEFEKIFSDPGFYSFLPWKSVLVVPINCYFRKPLENTLDSLPFFGKPSGSQMFYLQLSEKQAFLAPREPKVLDWFCEEILTKDPVACGAWWAFLDRNLQAHKELFGDLLTLEVSNS